jgi:hypothetical protein
LKPHVSLIEEVRELTRQLEINLQLQREKEVKEQVEKKRILTQKLIEEISSEIKDIAKRSCIVEYILIELIII